MPGELPTDLSGLPVTPAQATRKATQPLSLFIAGTPFFAEQIRACPLAVFALGSARAAPLRVASLAFAAAMPVLIVKNRRLSIRDLTNSRD